MALELHIFKAEEFIRLGAHGELDWKTSRSVLAKLIRKFIETQVPLGILDVRDASSHMSDRQIADLAHVFTDSGLSHDCRIAVLHRPRQNPRSDIFATSAVLRGFDVCAFDDFERAVEWLSDPRVPDPEFDRETYIDPKAPPAPRPRRPDDTNF